MNASQYGKTDDTYDLSRLSFFIHLVSHLRPFELVQSYRGKKQNKTEARMKKQLEGTISK